MIGHHIVDLSTRQLGMPTWRRGASRVVLLTLWLLSAAALAPVHAQATASPIENKPFVVEYYYKAKWGGAAEFLRLFRKNHYPLLKQQMEDGRILSIKAESPFYHSTEEGRWDLRVTVAWKGAVIAHDDYDGVAIRRKLFPDEDTFKREEQRRFELLLSHWDVVVTPVELQAQ